MSKVVWIIILIVIGVGGLIYLDKRQANSDCKERALAAAVDTYPINEYPNTIEREQLQKTYESRYLESCH